MKKYIKLIIALESLSIAYGIYIYIIYTTSYFLFIAAFIAMLCSVVLFWICSNDKTLNIQRKKIGLIAARIFVVIGICAIAYLIFLTLMMY